MSEYTITNDTPVYCWTCENVEKWKDAHLSYSGYEDDFLPYCSKCGSRSYLEKKVKK